jgi:selenocysteine lyase/cysteine desulfurase
MLGPEGLALLYTSPEIRAGLKLQQYGWRMVAAPGDFDRPDWAVSEIGTRFECGSPNMLGIHALHASISLLLETGMDKVSRRLLHNREILCREIEAIPELHLISDRRPERGSGIVTFRPGDRNPESMAAELMAKGIICAARGGGIRFSPHFYTQQQHIEKALRTVGEMCCG